MAFDPRFLDELKARVGLADLIGRRVKLRRHGREHTGLCPFHTEKTPSFTVSEDKGFYHCFGCGAHGNAYDFVIRTENLSFPEAVEKLAQEAGMSVPRLTPEARAQADRLSSLAEVMERAAAWFESELQGRAGQAAREYLAQRGVAAGTASEFRLGFAPDRPDALSQALLARGATQALLVEAGLVALPDDGRDAYDRFRNRLMFPIADRRGRVIAFGGRALGEARAKYLNSPETPLFHKGRALYNLGLAREAAAAAGTVVVVEGYMDVIALAGAGLRHVVAPLGTALTEDQMHLLWRLAPEPVLCLDGDQAGRRAALRAAERALALLKPGRSLRFAELPSGQDPDDLVRQGGRRRIDELLAAAEPLADFLWRWALASHRADTPERKAELEAALMAQVRSIADDTVRSYYRRDFRDRFWTAQRGAAGRGGGPGRRRRLAPPPRPPAAVDPSMREQVLIATLIHHPELLYRHEEELAQVMLKDPDLALVRDRLLAAMVDHATLDSAAIRRQLTSVGLAKQADRLSDRRITDLHRFARQDATIDDAEAGFLQALRLQQKVALEAELEDAVSELAQGDEAAWARVRSLREQLDQIDQIEAVGIVAGVPLAGPSG